jgi:hypothetical protein
MQFNPGAVSILLLIVYLLIAGVRIDDRDRTGLVRTAAVLLLTLTGYFFVYVMTPLDLGYHLATSLNRLFLQLWPSVIFLFFMAAGAPERAVSAEARPGPGSARPKTRSAPLLRKHQGSRTHKKPKISSPAMGVNNLPSPATGVNNLPSPLTGEG